MAEVSGYCEDCFSRALRRWRGQMLFSRRLTCANLLEFFAAQPRCVVALEVLGLGSDTDAARLRRSYTELVRRYRPDRNGGDRAHEARLNAVVDAYQLLRKSAALA